MFSLACDFGPGGMFSRTRVGSAQKSHIGLLDLARNSDISSLLPLVFCRESIALGKTNPSRGVLIFQLDPKSYLWGYTPVQ